MIALENSLSALAQVGVRETGATGYALFVQKPAGHGLLRICGTGESIAPETLRDAQTTGTLRAFPLHTNYVPDGLLAFAFKDRPSAARAETRLRVLAETIGKLWAVRDLDEVYRQLASRAGALQMQLIDSKIADRALGFLLETSEAQLMEGLAGQVSNVLRPMPALGVLETLVQELEHEMDDRRVTAAAKAILQAAHSLSEEQAYKHLRTLSRKSRRRLRDVAQDVIANRPLAAPAA